MKPFTLKFLERDMKRIDRLLEASSEYDNKSDFIRTAVQELLDRKERELKVKFAAESIVKAGG